MHRTSQMTVAIRCVPYEVQKWCGHFFTPATAPVTSPRSCWVACTGGLAVAGLPAVPLVDAFMLVGGFGVASVMGQLPWLLVVLVVGRC